MPKHLPVWGNFRSAARIRSELGYQEQIPLREAVRRTLESEQRYAPREIDPGQFDYAAEDRALRAR